VDWHRGPGTGEEAAAEVAQLLARAQEELGGPLLGARFLYDARQMLAATREIERAASAPGTTLYVGFQRADKLDGQARTYRNLTSQGVQVIAFGTATPTQVPQVRWVRRPEDHGALANQWFLVIQAPEPIAFVGFETSPPDRIGQGGAADPSRTWAGFVTDDPRLVGAIASHLRGLADQAAPVPDGRGTGPSTMLLVATDDGPWTSQNHGPAGDRPLDLPELVRLGRRYLADQVAEGRAFGLQVGAWLARGTGPAALAAACERLGVDRVVLPDKLARPSLRDRVLGRTLAGFQDRLSAKITLVDDQGALVDA
jgi:hypothetical protein